MTVTPLKRRLTNAFGLLFVVGVVGVVAYGLFRMLYWDPRHRPLVVLPHPSGGSVEIDGVAVCTGLPAYANEAGARPCSVVIEPGVHTVVTKSAAGAEVHRDTAQIAQGESTYLVSHELPPGQCLALVMYAYKEVVIDIPGLSHGPPRKPVAAGFADLGAIDDLLKAPLRTVQSQEKEAKRIALRLEECAARGE